MERDIGTENGPCQRQNLVLTVLVVPSSLDSGHSQAWSHGSQGGSQRRCAAPPFRCLANLAHIRQSSPDPGLSFHVKALKSSKLSLFARKRSYVSLSGLEMRDPTTVNMFHDCQLIATVNLLRLSTYCSVPSHHACPVPGLEMRHASSRD